MTDSIKEEDKTDLPSTEKQNRIDYPRKDYREEYAAEVTPAGTFSGNAVRGRNADTDGEIRDVNRVEGADSDVNTAGRTVGYVGVGLGIASLFLWSIILGPLAAVMGFYAYSQGNKTSGAWGIGLGIVSTLSYFVLMPFTR
ncbi:hypothetical protein EHV15_30015 [Paenibacillus oralis]|uniref:DUF4190 domain-containing protein n=1 Tax=Paenibacillus oralis TaxID=2490856 RepID=A0A3P3U950_9BACL|nr:hypothetical protein [Paenibacillus oralis]RRJ66694.1 hypothetical protein EHV15_30015 [Paenibacillus oralis]